METRNLSPLVQQNDQSKERLSALGIPQKDQDHAFTQLNDGLERIERTRQAEILGAEALLAAHLELE